MPSHGFSIPAIVCVIGAAIGSPGYAQSEDSLIGTYGGGFTIDRGPKPFEAGMELVLTSVERGAVIGNAKILAGQCAGAYAMQGKYENNNLIMKGSGGPCPFGFSAKRAGNDLIGSTGAGFPLRLSLGATAVTSAPVAAPDESLLGTYTGNFLGWEPLNIYVGMKLVLSSVDAKGIVKGTATVYDGPCAGTYAMQGRVQGDEVGVRGTGGGCDRFGFRAKREGNTLVGTVGDRPLHLYK